MSMMTEIKSGTPTANQTLHRGGLPVSLPAWAYTSDELVDIEYEKVILPSWQFVCHISQVKNPGDFMTLDMKKDSIRVMRGTIHGIIGENGAGKSTLMKILAGVHQSDSGEIVYKGSTYRHFTPREALDKGISVIPSSFALFIILSSISVKF